MPDASNQMSNQRNKNNQFDQADNFFGRIQITYNKNILLFK